MSKTNGTHPDVQHQHQAILALLDEQPDAPPEILAQVADITPDIATLRLQQLEEAGRIERNGAGYNVVADIEPLSTAQLRRMMAVIENRTQAILEDMLEEIELATLDRMPNAIQKGNLILEFRATPPEPGEVRRCLACEREFQEGEIWVILTPVLGEYSTARHAVCFIAERKS